MQHLELFDRDHFEYNFKRKKAAAQLNTYIDFFWETQFDALWPSKPQFTDALFPNIGYTYMINLGTPFSVQLDTDEAYTIKTDAFVPRYRNISTHHSAGNHVFGIKFTISPLVLEKNVDFSEYLHAPASLAYLIPPDILRNVKAAASFEDRIRIVSAYYTRLINRYENFSRPVKIVRDCLLYLRRTNNWEITVSELALMHSVDIRTLQRYFESTTSISTKQAIQMLKVRSAITALIDSPETFSCKIFGYYDNSHFNKQINAFFNGHPAFERSTYLPQLHHSPVKILY